MNALRQVRLFQYAGLASSKASNRKLASLISTYIHKSCIVIFVLDDQESIPGHSWAENDIIVSPKRTCKQTQLILSFKITILNQKNLSRQ